MHKLEFVLWMFSMYIELDKELIKGVLHTTEIAINLVQTSLPLNKFINQGKKMRTKGNRMPT